MTSVDRRKIVPLPGIMALFNFPETKPYYVAASAITSVIPYHENGLDFIVFNAMELPTSIAVKVESDQEAFEYVKIWAQERTVK